MMAYAKDVHKEGMRITRFQAVIVNPKGSWKSYIQICRPMKVTSLILYVYYVSFIDYYSRKTWIYFLKVKK